MPVYVNPYLSTEDVDNTNTTYIYIIFQNDPSPDDYGQYIFEPNNLSNQFPGRFPDHQESDLFSWSPSGFNFTPYEYKIRRDITIEKNRKLYVSNIAMTIGSHKYSRTGWRLAYYDNRCKVFTTGYTFDDLVNDYGYNTTNNAPFDRRAAWFVPQCNQGLYNPPYHRDGKYKAEFYDDVSRGIQHYMHEYSDALTGAGSAHWSGKWTIGNYNTSDVNCSDTESDCIHYSNDLMSPANTSFYDYIRPHPGMGYNSRNGAPLNVSGGSNNHEWKYTQVLPLETPIRTTHNNVNGDESETMYEEDTQETYTVSGLEAQGIHDLFSQTYSTDTPSLPGSWYICVWQNADGWEWRIENWVPGWHDVSRNDKWQCFIVPKQDYVNNWFDVVSSYNLGNASGGHDNPINYTHNGRTYVKHYGVGVSYTSTGASWNCQTSLDTYMAIGSIPPTMANIGNIGLFSKYHSDFMGWINPEAPHSTNDPLHPFRFYNPFRNDGTDDMYTLLDLTGVKKPNGEQFKIESHAKKLQEQFRPIIKTTTTNGLIETQRRYTEGEDSGFELVSAPAEVEFSVDIKSNQSFFPSDEWTIEGESYTLNGLKEELGIEYKFFVVDWGDSGLNTDGDMDGVGAGDYRVNFPQTISEWNTAANNNTFIVFNHQNIQTHTYYEEGIYAITAYVMCVKPRVLNGVREDMVITMKKTETKIRIEKEFIFYPDYLHLGGGDFPIIPWTSGAAPIISGISEKSDYTDSLRKILGGSTFLFSEARENFLKGKTKNAYRNEELGEFLGKTDIGQIRYFTNPYDINYLLGLNQLSHSSLNLRVERGNCEYENPITNEIQPLNDRIYGDTTSISFFSSLYSGQAIGVSGFNNNENNTLLVNEEDIAIINNYFIVDYVNVTEGVPFISIRNCELFNPSNGDEAPSDSFIRTISLPTESNFTNNIVTKKEYIGTYACEGAYVYNDNCNATNVGNECGPETTPGETTPRAQTGICVEETISTKSWTPYTDKYWGMGNKFSPISAATSIFINESNYKTLKDSCILEYNFDDNDGISIRDSSGNQNNGIIIGDYGLLKVAEDIPMGLGSSIKKPRINENDDGVL